jgi:hypothetical protein
VSGLVGGQFRECRVRPSGRLYRLTEVGGHDGRSHLPALGQEDAAAKEAHRSDQLGEVRSRLGDGHAFIVHRRSVPKGLFVQLDALYNSGMSNATGPIFQTYDLAAGIPAVFIGRCASCRQPFRVEIPAEIADRFGPRLPNCIGAVLPAAGITPPSCDCGGSVKFAIVKTTYKAEEACGGRCWSAKSTTCSCSCRGRNHGGAHGTGGF